MMHDQAVWSLFLGRWRGIEFRVHIFFLLFAALTLFLSGLAASANPDLDAHGLGVLSLVLLFGSVVIHELAHVITANVLGGQSRMVVVGPLGGLATLQMPRSQWGELTVLVAGPLANVGLCGITGLSMYLLRGEFAWPRFIETWETLNGTPDRLGMTLHVLLFVNYFLFLINLIPAYPFDGGRVLRILLVALIPTLRPDHAVRLVAFVAKLVCCGLLGMAWLNRDVTPIGGVPVWFALTLLSIFILFSARREEFACVYGRMADDSNEGPFAPLRERESVLVGVRRTLNAWRQKRLESQLEQQAARDELEDLNLDAVLQRLHEIGMENLSPEERSVLQRVSKRYRDRPSSGQS